MLVFFLFIFVAMKENSENTAAFILEKVAPIFNRQGYIGTSLSDLTKATQLTKGALYFHFKNKEELALKAFHLNLNKVIHPLQAQLSMQSNAVDKLFALTNYYRVYYKIVSERGGCPIINVGVDAKHNNPALFKASKDVSATLVNGLAAIIQKGIAQNEIQKNCNANAYAQNFFSMIEGAVFMSLLQEDESHLEKILDMIDSIIIEKLKN